MTDIVYRCPFCGLGTKPVLVERKRVGAKCVECNYIHFYNYSDTQLTWFYEHSEQLKENKGPKEKA